MIRTRHVHATDAIHTSIRTADALHTPSWIRTAPGLPYFLTEDGQSWTPVGQNDAVNWPDLAGLFRRRNLPAVEAYLRDLKASGVTCLRIMLEYWQDDHRALERPVGVFTPNMVRLWDDLFVLLEQVGLHVLLTPFDTFFMWKRWTGHAYNQANGGPCSHPREMLICPGTRAAIKARLAFASARWGGSPALFAWDVWNEMHPAQSRDDPAHFTPFLDDVAHWLRGFEIERHGRAHLLTASVFSPELYKHPQIADPIFRHPALDFANTHMYESGTINNPKDTVGPAVTTGRLISEAVMHAVDGRPVFDSEHGPIHLFKDRHVTLPEPFDDEYFRHMQWAHLASGGAGGGMRWPNRHPHQLTRGMRAAQRVLRDFLPRLDWTRFRRRALNGTVRVQVQGAAVHCFACGDAGQAVVWLLRTDTVQRNGMVARDAPPVAMRLTIPGLRGRCTIEAVDTRSGDTVGLWDCAASADGLTIQVPPFVADLALAIRRVDSGVESGVDSGAGPGAGSG